MAVNYRVGGTVTLMFPALLSIIQCGITITLSGNLDPLLAAATGFCTQWTRGRALFIMFGVTGVLALK